MPTERPHQTSGNGAHSSGGGESFIRIDSQRNTFKVAREVFTRPDIYERERALIFDKCWLYVGHSSEVREPGQFQVRPVGGREVIFCSDRNGKVNAFYNSCPHRGARLCTEKAGIAKNFTCYYHGWAFGLDGALRGIPQQDRYAADFNKDGSSNLARVPRLEQYRGLYFVCFDPDAVSLKEYLGEAVRPLDFMLDQGEAMEIVAGRQEYSIRGNWKLLSENSVDGNHGETLHGTYFEYLRSVTPGAAKSPPPALNLIGVATEFDGGHTLLEYESPMGRVQGRWSPLWGEECKPDIEAEFADLVKRFGEAHAREVALTGRNLLIFPNLAIVNSTGLVLRVVHPEGVGSLRSNTYALAPVGERPRVRKIRLFNFIEFLGPGGFATPDDIEAIEQSQRSFELNGGVGWNDLSKGPILERRTEQFEEGTVRAFWRGWGRYMNDPGIVP